METGSVGEARRVVTPELTALHLRSGDVEVLGTPALLALVEEAAVACVAPSLEKHRTSVGAWVELEHLSPSRVGAEVRAIARLVESDGKALTFECEAYEGDRLIGRARHRRVIVDRARFGA